MKRAIGLLAVSVSIVLATPARAGPAEDATAAVTTWLDKFNAGDMDAFYAGHRDGAVIVDEFAPYVWGGPQSAQHWLADYMKDAEAKGISGGRVDYEKTPLQASSDGNTAYVVLPTTYRFTEKGAKKAGKGSMTFVMTRSGKNWKIASWTYSGVTPSAE